jgi:hypothetical protein
VDPHLALDRAMQALLSEGGDASEAERHRVHSYAAAQPELA